MLLFSKKRLAEAYRGYKVCPESKTIATRDYIFLVLDNIIHLHYISLGKQPTWEEIGKSPLASKSCHDYSGKLYNGVSI